jgi:hypothetical protein
LRQKSRPLQIYKTLASIEMNRIYQIIIFTLFVCGQSVAQAESNLISDLPFSSYLILSYDSTKLTKPQDSLIVWNQIEKVDSTIKWKLVGLRITNSGYHAGSGELNRSIKSSVYSVIDTLPIINSYTLNTHFKLNESDLRETRNWIHSDLSTDWTPFQHGNILMISRRDRAIGNMYDFTTVYEYYFEKI